ncbi:molybdenum cofactor synthesis domain-containing protein, partial [Thermus sp.]
MRTRVGLVTVSHRASQGVYQDLSGPEAVAYVRRRWPEAEILTRLVPDEVAWIQGALLDLLVQDCRLILTTGGTGSAPRDVTPEATLRVVERVYPGFGEAMRLAFLKETPTAILSRQLAGSVGKALVVNPP